MAKDQTYKRVVVKLGSNLLTDADQGLSRVRLDKYVNALAKLRAFVPEVVLVSSGAIAAGYARLNYASRPSSVVAKQACAAVGQGLLIQAYTESFAAHGLSVAQVLLTRGDFARRESYNNALNTLSLLLEKGVVPIINENDTVSIRELTFGENDLLAALVATLLQADYLVIFSSACGLFDRDPSLHPEAKLIERVDEISPKIRAMASASTSSKGTGGMVAKLAAAELALSMGIPVFIGGGVEDCDLKAVLDGSAHGTYFTGRGALPVKRKRQWIAYHAVVKGRIDVDEGAAVALIKRGKSLLPVGVRGVKGEFKLGEVVEVCNAVGEVLGKGIVNYSALDLRRVMGLSTDQARGLIGVDRVEVIHRNDWVSFAAMEVDPIVVYTMEEVGHGRTDT